MDTNISIQAELSKAAEISRELEYFLCFLPYLVENSSVFQHYYLVLLAQKVYIVISSVSGKVSSLWTEIPT